MQKIIIQKVFSQEESGQYTRIPFQMPEGVDAVDISYAYDRFIQGNEVNIIDLGLFAPEGNLVGWSGSDRLHVSVSDHGSTPGYHKIRLVPGSWAIAVGIYKVTKSVQIIYTIEFHERTEHLFVGDLHMHTHHSDGKFSVYDTVMMAKKAGLDFVALTDHNNTEQNGKEGEPEGISVFYGMEYTNYRGHANFFLPEGMREFPFNPLSNTVDEVRGLFLSAKEMGITISLNHICDDGCPWLFGFTDIPFDMVEVWNGCMTPANMRSIKTWDELLKEGKRIPAVGGSDMHRLELSRTYGTPSNNVVSCSLSASDIISSVKSGKNSLSFSPSGPISFLTIDGKGQGEVVEAKADSEAEVTVKQAKPHDMVSIVSATSRQDIEVLANGTFTFLFVPEAQRYYRVEVYRELWGIKMLSGLSNPVYIA